jgi:hypothetical protein
MPQKDILAYDNTCFCGSAAAAAVSWVNRVNPFVVSPADCSAGTLQRWVSHEDDRARAYQYGYSGYTRITTRCEVLYTSHQHHYEHPL